MFLEKIFGEVSNIRYTHCTKDGEVVYVIHNGRLKYTILNNGVIRRLCDCNDDVFYVLFDIVSKIRAELLVSDS